MESRANTRPVQSTAEEDGILNIANTLLAAVKLLILDNSLGLTSVKFEPNFLFFY